MNRNDRLEIVETFFFNIIFTLFILAVFIIVSALTADFDKLVKPEFWALTSIKVGALIILFNWYRFTGIKIRKRTKKPYRKANIIHSKMCDIVKAKGLRPKVEEVIAKRNQANQKEAHTLALEQLTNIITLEEINKWSEGEIRKKCKEHGYNWRHTRKIIRIAKRIRQGKIKYIRYTVHQLLHNPTSNKVGIDISDVNEPANLICENLYVGIRYVLTVVIISLVSWEGNIYDLIIGILLNITLALTSVISGTKSADDYVGRCTDRLNNKNDILAEVEGIDYAEAEREANEIIAKEMQMTI